MIEYCFSSFYFIVSAIAPESEDGNATIIVLFKARIASVFQGATPIRVRITATIRKAIR